MDNQNLNNDVNNQNNQDINNNQNNQIDTRDNAQRTIDAVESFIDTPDHTKEYTQEDLKLYKTSAMISYIPFVCFYFILLGKIKSSNYLKFHVNQGLNITVIVTAVYFLDKTVTSFFSRDSLVLNSTPGIVSFVLYALYFICFLYILFGISNTSNDLSKELPIIGKIRLLK